MGELAKRGTSDQRKHCKSVQIKDFFFNLPIMGGRQGRYLREWRGMPGTAGGQILLLHNSINSTRKWDLNWCLNSSLKQFEFCWFEETWGISGSLPRLTSWQNGTKIFIEISVVIWLNCLLHPRVLLIPSSWSSQTPISEQESSGNNSAWKIENIEVTVSKRFSYCVLAINRRQLWKWYSYSNTIYTVLRKVLYEYIFHE
jgi:hypothetical protein